MSIPGFPYENISPHLTVRSTCSTSKHMPYRRGNGAQTSVEAQCTVCVVYVGVKSIGGGGGGGVSRS